jgi:hypothetical protein
VIAAELIESAHALASLLESKSLRHPDHLSLIQPITRQVKRLITQAFNRQGRVLVHARKTGIVPVLEREGEPPLGIDSWLDNIAPLALSFTHREVSTYDALMGRAIRKAEAQLESELVSGAVIPDTVMTGYLREHSLSKLSGSLAETTKQQLRTAIADTVQAGGTADDITQAIQETMDGMGDSRAEMIAQTEVNTAYNTGRMELGLAAGFNEKRWVTESGAPCVICIINQTQDFIPINQAFLSGDQFPTAHPMCFCSVDFRVISGRTTSQ